MHASRIAVIGAGSWGSALASLLAHNGYDVLIYARAHIVADDINQHHQNTQYLNDLHLADTLSATNSLEAAVEGRDLILLAIPSHGFEQTLIELKPYVNTPTFISATKGLMPDGGFLHQAVYYHYGDVPCAVLSGPSFAKEVANALPTAIVISSRHDSLARIAGCFNAPHFRVYQSQDMVGVQLGGAIKNVIAIAAGISDGLGFGANAKSALITRGLAEMMRLGAQLGADKKTLTGLAGMGDLVLTCTDDQSRNRRYGLAIGSGLNLDQARAQVKQVVEGATAARTFYQLAQKNQVDMPLIQAVYNVVHEGLAPKKAVDDLLSRIPDVE